MTKFQKNSLVWFVIYLVVLGSVILFTSGCYSGRVGCPVNAQRGFGHGRIR